MSPSSEARLPLWLLTDARGAVSACCPGSEQLVGLELQGRTLGEVFGEAVARQLLSGPEDALEWSRAAAREGEAPTRWRVVRYRLEGGGLLIRAGALTALEETAPSEWERRFSPRLIQPHGDVVAQQRAFMLSIFDADPTYIFVKDREGCFIFVNKALADSFSTTPDELVRAYNAEVLRNPQELRHFSAVDQQVLTTLTEVRLEESITLQDGKTSWFDTRKRPLQALNGEIFVLGISVDITERRRIELLLQEANLRLELAVSSAHLGLWDWDVIGETVYFSPIWKAQLGFEDAELPNTFETWNRLLHPEDRERTVEAVLQFVRDPTRGDRFVNEFRMIARDGSVRWIAGYGVVVRDARGVTARVTGLQVDITERKEREAAQELLRENLRRTNEHLERLGRMKDEFLANMSHELRTPLNAVLGQAEAMSEGIFGPLTEEQRASLKTIDESGQHLLSLINDVLDITKGSAGRLELHLARMSIEEVCQESLRLVREQARRKRITVSYASDGGVASLWADSRRLKQILINLLSNAKKFTPEGGRIGLEVSARQEGAAVAFTVWDTGCGIASEDRQRIFEPFVQLDAGLARRHEGSGLGLSLVRRLVELHHGTLELESEVGKGSRFTVVLPVSKP